MKQSTGPIISVVIPYFNHGSYILEAIESVELNDHKLFEIIIVNDGSTDPKSLEVIESLTNNGYNVINQLNQGLGTARNNGIKAAQGKYILPLDSDNKINPLYLKMSIDILDADDSIGVVYGNPVFFGDISEKRTWKTPAFNKTVLLFANYIDACAIFRKQLWENVGGYDEKMPWMGHEDWDFWIRISALNNKFYHINESMFYYRVISNSMISSVGTSKEIDNYAHIIKKNPKTYATFLFNYRNTIINLSSLSKTKLWLLQFMLKIIKRLPL
jgi:glycosyltransferase involved in cell wall biosynthesis